jgi:Dehydrogenases with different specificities (related to short-chain alcohol dehydrogenases)
MKLKNRVAVITGAAKGIGMSIALKFAEEGSDLVICDIDLDSLKKVENSIKEIGREVLAEKVDVTKKVEIVHMIKNAIAKFGKIDILVNNAGIMLQNKILDITEEEWDMTMQVNLKSSFLCSQAIIKHMIDNRYGRIINIASLAGQQGALLAGASYAASKAGVLGLTKTLAKEVGQYRITVNAVAPGNINAGVTLLFPKEEIEKLEKTTPIRRYGEPQEVANVVSFLASEESSYINGATININGGFFTG